MLSKSQRVFKNDYFVVSANKLVSHISTKSSHLFSSAISMKLGCLFHGMWKCLKNLLFKKFSIQVFIGLELEHKDRVWYRQLRGMN